MKRMVIMKNKIIYDGINPDDNDGYYDDNYEITVMVIVIIIPLPTLIIMNKWRTSYIEQNKIIIWLKDASK